MSKKYKNVKIVDHPILQHHLTLLRDRRTQPAQFRALMGTLTKFLCYEATRDLKTNKKDVETPLDQKVSSIEIAEPVVLTSIMRAGNAMLESAIDIFPFAEVGHIGIYRDKFIQSTVEYFFRLPDELNKKTVILLDPLLATGDTADAAITRLKDNGATKVHFVCALAAPAGIEKISEKHADTTIFCLSIEEGLNDRGYILPGIGDAGDRLYGTGGVAGGEVTPNA